MKEMKKYYKGFAAVLTAVTVMFSGCMNVSAAGVRDVFDAKYYADSNEDLKAAFGYDEEALFSHYMTSGISEGRSASAEFDVAQYRKNYADLEQIFGDDWDAYVDHYFNLGMAEGRTSEALVSKSDAQSAAGLIYDALIAQKAVFPEGTPWTNGNYIAWSGGIYSGGFGCAGFAFALSDAAFGNARARIHQDYNNIRVGDILRVNNGSHSVIVLEVKDASVVVAEGNYNSSVHWGREISRASLPGDGNYIMTRYQD